ncbi:PA2169 family four-helix-bundle protein [Maribacter litopenaei]|uniref:PA2169 family four-helix-bundle protein n=1 Tax=Maribacter litopenaei TaxID=2976127 RepID=UPI0030841A8E
MSSKRKYRPLANCRDKGGSIKGDLHRTWMNFTTTFTSDDTERILEEVERGEKASPEEYNEILNDDDMVLAPSTENMLKKHRNEIKEALNNAKIYEEAVS